MPSAEDAKQEAEPLASSAVQPAGAVVTDTHARNLPVFITVGVVLLVLFVGALFISSWDKPNIAKVDEPLPLPALPTTPVRPQPEVPSLKIAREVAPLPHEYVLAPMPVPIPIPVPMPKVEAKRIEKINAFDGLEHKLDLPDGIAEIQDLNGEERLILTGKVKVLKLGHIAGASQIDASKLEVGEIIFTANIDGSAEVKLNAPAGKVTMSHQVDGSAKLTIHAPGGEVIFRGEDGHITGGTRLTITAKRVDFQSDLTGGTHIDATLTKGGSLRTRRMTEGATVRYQLADASDPEPKIETGELSGGASVKPKK